MSFSLEELYALLPAEYRIRDGKLGQIKEGGPLKALLKIIAEQVAVLEEDLAQRYDDHFIETCAEWVVPYIGDLVNAHTVNDLVVADIDSRIKSRLRQRAQVANTLAYRRRKGTLAVLEQVARDASGWPARAVEFYKLLATSQAMNHVRIWNSYAPDLRRGNALALLNTPFDSIAHTVEVRRIASRQGKYNIPNVGIFLWRLRANSLSGSPAFRTGPRRYRFHPLGIDTQLFNDPNTEQSLENLAEAIHVPMPISRRLFHTNREQYYGPGKSIFLEVDGQAVDSSRIVVCKLTDHDGAWAHQPEDKYGIDPVLGRIALPKNGPDAQRITVSFRYGFSADMGGGEYVRFFPDLPSAAKVTVPTNHDRIQDALEAAGDQDRIVEVDNSDRYEESLTIDLDEGRHLELRAGNKYRPTLFINGELSVKSKSDASLTLDGFLISGGPLVVKGDLGRLSLRHCTLVPGTSLRSDGTPEKPDAPVLIVRSPSTKVEIDHCILGRLQVGDNHEVIIKDSIIDATGQEKVAYSGPGDRKSGGPLKVLNTTFIGRVLTRSLEASNTIFFSRVSGNAETSVPVFVENRQEGCLRYSFVPVTAKVPRRYHCHPGKNSDGERITPSFTSLRYGAAGYAQLLHDCAVEIREGAENGSEMGAFNALFQGHRLRNVSLRMDEYLRFNLEAGLFLVD